MDVREVLINSDMVVGWGFKSTKFGVGEWLRIGNLLGTQGGVGLCLLHFFFAIYLLFCYL